MRAEIPKGLTYELKAGTRDLVAAAGGLKRAEVITGLSAGQLSRCQSPQHADIVSLSAAAALELETGLPAITTIMAHALGFRLVAADAAPSPCTVVPAHAAVMSEFGDVSARLGEALADGVVSPAEADAIDREAGEMSAKIHDFRAALGCIKAGVGR